MHRLSCVETPLNRRRVFTIGQTNVTEFLETTFSATPALIPAIKAAYSIGSVGLTNGYDVISAIATDVQFQCVCPLQLQRVANVQPGMRERCQGTHLRSVQ